MGEGMMENAFALMQRPKHRTATLHNIQTACGGKCGANRELARRKLRSGLTVNVKFLVFGLLVSWVVRIS